MGKKQMLYSAMGFGTLLLAVVVLLLAWGGQREPGGIVLPAPPGDASGMEEDGGDNPLSLLAITPDTVKPAINTLSRPLSYSRTQMVETFWSGGSGQSISQIYVSGGRTRLDTLLADGSVRHLLLANGMAGVWYDDETACAIRRAGQLTSDLAGRMLTYETVRDLPVEEIAKADYRSRDEVYCIYVETQPDGDGCAERYWVSVENGLLYAAERVSGGQVVYRFTAGQPDNTTPEESLFLLPDGSVLAAEEEAA